MRDTQGASLVDESTMEGPGPGQKTRTRVYQDGTKVKRVEEILDENGKVVAATVTEERCDDFDNALIITKTEMDADGNITCTERKKAYDAYDYEGVKGYQRNSAFRGDGGGPPDIAPKSDIGTRNETLTVKRDGQGNIVQTKKTVTDPETGNVIKSRIDRGDTHRTRVESTNDKAGNMERLSLSGEDPDSSAVNKFNKYGDGSWDFSSRDKDGLLRRYSKTDSQDRTLFEYESEVLGGKLEERSKRFNPETGITTETSSDRWGFIEWSQKDKDGNVLAKVCQAKGGSGSAMEYQLGATKEDFEKGKLFSEDRYMHISKFRSGEGESESIARSFTGPSDEADIERKLTEIQEGRRSQMIGSDVIVKTDFSDKFERHAEYYDKTSKSGAPNEQETMRKEVALKSAIRKSPLPVKPLPEMRTVKTTGFGDTRMKALDHALTQASEVFKTKVQSEHINTFRVLNKVKGKENLTQITKDTTQESNLTSYTAASQYRVTGVRQQGKGENFEGAYEVKVEFTPGILVRE